ncbi:TIGR04219 family outer membrane beta-barrel protein [Gallaecimonas sp. GXIMD4217]|uniref:TIGR04219 family outer membrane beta-barrel protein n=1 Tax=Gallaecimonas sp. GXIMD4217 TaxID=3131927 RepID=UPI00311AE0F1
MKKGLLFAALAGAMALPAAADTLGIYAGVGQWQSDFSGDVTTEQVQLDNELGLKDSDVTQGYIHFEHPVPAIPNVRLAYADISESGTGTVSREFEYGGNIYQADTQVSSSFDLTMTDVTLYYELWDMGGDLDLGITARNLDGDLAIDSEFDSGREDIDGWIPMLYAAVRFDLPLTGLYIGGQANGISYSGNSLIDYKVALGYEFDLVAIDLGLELGYRSLELELDEDDVGDFESDIQLDGAFLNLVMHF